MSRFDQITPNTEKPVPSEKEQAMAELLAALEKVRAAGGEDLIRRVGVSLAGTRTVSLAAIEADIQREKNEKEFRAFVFERLKLIDLLKEVDGKLIVDAEGLKKVKLQQLGLVGNQKGALHSSRQEQFRPLTEQGIYRILALTFARRRVISNEEWKKSQAEGRAPEEGWLQYLPATVFAATNQQSIKGARFLLAPWNMSNLSQDWQDVYQFPDGSLTLEELSAAGMIYHPSCGDGVREADGRLLVRDGKNETRARISGSWFIRNKAYRGSQREGGISLDSPVRWLLQHPVLQEKGILREADFTTQSTSAPGEDAKAPEIRYTERHGVTGVGNVMFNGISHHLGRKFMNRTDLLIVNLSPTLGLCARRLPSGDLEPECTFRIFQKSDPEVQVLASQGKFLSMTKTLVQPTPVSNKLMQGPVSGESERDQLVRTFILSRSHEKDAATETVPQFAKSTRLSVEVAGLIGPWLKETTNPERLERFRTVIKAHGDLGARFCLAFKPEELGGLFQICQRFPELGVAATQAVLERCVELVKSGVSDALRLTHDLFAEAPVETESLNEEVEQVLNRRWKRTLLQLSREKRLSFDQLQSRLESLKKENILFSSVFRSVFKGRDVKEAFELIKGVTFETAVSPSEIDDRTKKEMSHIFDLNWIDQDRTAAAAFKASLQNKLSDPTLPTKFYLLKKQGEVVAFIRFDDRPDLEVGAVYGGSLNVHPAFRRSGIGEAMMQRTIDEVAKEHPIYAHVVPEAVVGTAYVEQMNCMIVGVDMLRDPNTQKTTQLLKLRRDDHRHYRARAQNVTWEALRANAVPGVKVLCFDLASQQSAFLEAIRAATAHGHVITRYRADTAHPSVRWIAIESEQLPVEKTTIIATPLSVAA